MTEIVVNITEEGKTAVAKKKFVSRKDELLVAILSYVFAYFYITIFWYDNKWPQVLLVAAFVAGTTEYLNREVSASIESRIWLVCFLAVAVCLTYSAYRAEAIIDGEHNLFCIVFSTSELMLIVHCYAIWYVLVRSGKLLKGETGSFFPVDVLNAGIVIPFGNFFLRARTVIWSIGKAIHKRKSEKSGLSLWIIAAIPVCTLLLVSAIKLLAGADDYFGDMVWKLTDMFTFRLNGELVIRIIFSIPVGMYLFGLIAGSRRITRNTIDYKLSGYERVMASMRKIPSGFWIVVITLFMLVYLAFFIVQGRYLFGAITGRMPEGFIVSEYARQGFFEMCMVMAVNFALLVLVRIMTGEDRDSARAGKRLHVACLMLLAESMLFAVIAFSKLALYISCFGFTPRRLQSTWAVCVLFAACAFWMYSMLTDKKVFRNWLYLSTISLTLLCI